MLGPQARALFDSVGRGSETLSRFLAIEKINYADYGGEDYASRRASNCNGGSATHLQVENPEALLRMRSVGGRKTSTASKHTASNRSGVEHRLQFISHTVLRRLKFWLEDYFTRELPELAQVSLDRAVPELVLQHIEDVF